MNEQTETLPLPTLDHLLPQEVAWHEAHNLNVLERKGLLKPEEIGGANLESLTEIAERASQIMSVANLDGPETARGKVKTMLGLENQSPARLRRLELILKGFLLASYLWTRHGKKDLAGIIFCGSRTDTRKTPRPNSDLDVVLVLKESVQKSYDTDPSLPDNIEKAVRRIWGPKTEVDFTYDLYGKSLRTMQPSFARRQYKAINRHSIPFIWDKKVRNSFKRVFSGQMRKG